MARYIDADLIPYVESEDGVLNDYAYRYDINEMPTADVEIIRCKDCEYWQDKNSKGTQGICLCGEKDMNYGGEFYPFANDFCSYGKSRTPQKEG